VEVKTLHTRIRNRIFLIVPLYLLILTSHSFANSLPVYWQGYPSFEVLTLDSNSPIEVKHEHLIFDISEFDKLEHTITGRVTATYEMFNPTDENLTVQMAFPFISKVYNFSKEDISISAGNENIPFDIFLGEPVGSYGAAVDQEDISFDFSEVASAITAGPYHGKNFSETDEGILYTFEVVPENNEMVYFSVGLDEIDINRTKIVTDGFNSIEAGQNYIKVSGWCHEKTGFEIFVLGSDADFRIEGYTDGSHKQKTDNFTYTIFRKTLNVKVFIEDMVEKERAESDIINSTGIDMSQIYRMYISAMDEALSANSFITYNDLVGEFYVNRLIILLYNVQFPASSGKTVSVGYKALGTMDSRNTGSPLYTFSYLLTPAKYWAAFNNLDIEIITPSQAPHIVQSNIELEKTSPGHYTASLASLPEKDLYFTIHADSKINIQNRAYSYRAIHGVLSNPLVLVALMLVLFLLATFAVISIYRAKK